MDLDWGDNRKNVPLFLELVAQFKDFDLDLALALVLQQALVGLAQTVLWTFGVAWRVRSHVVARLHVGEVALDVARGARPAGGREADVVGHVCCCWGV